MTNFTFLSVGARLIAREDRSTFRIGDAIRGHAANNAGYHVKIDNTSLVQYIVGPCVMSIVDRDVAIMHASQVNDTWFRLAASVISPQCYRYTLLDGQRVLWITTPRGIDDYLFLQCSHSDFDDENWKSHFPEETWD